jgi:hypothetical protein
VSAPRGQRPQFGGEGVEIGVGFAAQRSLQNVPDFRLCGTPVPGGAAFEAGKQIVIEISHAQTSHCRYLGLLSMLAMIALALFAGNKALAVLVVGGRAVHCGVGDRKE